MQARDLGTQRIAAVGRALHQARMFERCEQTQRRALVELGALGQLGQGERGVTGAEGAEQAQRTVHRGGASRRGVLIGHGG